MKTKLILGIMLFLGLSIGANAQSLRDKDRGQHQRIEQGRRSGELTRGESHRLSKQQRHMHRQYQRYRRDGHISRGERRHLAYEQRRASHHIYRYKHNGPKRFY